MTNELREVLVKVEAAVQATKPILGRHDYTVDAVTRLRTPLVIGFMSQAIEHHEGMLLLIMKDMTGSAFALARSIVEGMYRGLWIDRAATDSEVDRFVKKDEIEIGMGTMAKAIDVAYGSGDAFSDLKKRSWDALNSYTHNGMLQLGRRFTKAEAKTSYTDAQKSEIMETVTTCILILVGSFLDQRGFVKERNEIDQVMTGYGPLFRRDTTSP
jgi:hypothetical protein